MWSTTQVPHIARVTLSVVLGIPEAKLRVIAPDVGGGFGSKLNVYAEEALALAIARRLGRPVKWTETRSEGYLSTIHGRDVSGDRARRDRGGEDHRGPRAADRDGRVSAARHAGDPAARRVAVRRLLRHQGYSFECTGVFTNTTPTDAYRGAGRPEATYAIERAVDALARKLGMDPVELRRLNFIREFPKTIAAGPHDRLGDYDASLDSALEHAGYEALRAEQQAAARSAATRSGSASASPPTSRCAGSRRRRSSARSATRRWLGGGHDPLPARPGRCRR